MIASFHLADVGVRKAPALLRPPRNVPGLRYAECGVGAPLNDKVLPSPQFGRIGMVCAWDDNAALDRFLETHPRAEKLRGGFHVRLEPLRISGAWSGFPELNDFGEQPVADDEPVAVITFGRVLFPRVPKFLRTNAPAAGLASKDPAVLASTALARPPRFVSTFSLWRSAKEMQDFAYGRTGVAHLEAIRAQNAKTFHKESAFIRFRPYAPVGTIGGREPLAAP
ncbi:MAG: spheroidene monooxygenase [Actinomycetota bacterium]